MLLIDEIHRFNKAQQDALLPHVEEGLITLIGATTENPYFEIIGPLLSRARIFIFEPLQEAEVLAILRRALADRERGLGAMALDGHRRGPGTIWPAMAGGDARRALNALELAVLSTDAGRARGHPGGPGGGQGMPAPAGPDVRPAGRGPLRHGVAPSSRASGAPRWTRPSTGWPGCWRRGKIRASSCGGCSILASEDIGLADPQALVQVAAASRALDLGGPAGRRSTTWPRPPCIWPWPPRATPPRPISGPRRPWRTKGATRVPAPLQDAHRDRKGLGHGQGYLYPHDFPGHWVDQAYLPEELAGASFYEPGTEGEEPELAARWRAFRKQGEESGSPGSQSDEDHNPDQGWTGSGRPPERI